MECPITEVQQTRVMGGLLRLVAVHYDGDSGACCGWVDPRTGDILYSGSWKRPGNAKPRGNVFDADYGASAFNEWGVRTLR